MEAKILEAVPELALGSLAGTVKHGRLVLSERLRLAERAARLVVEGTVSERELDAILELVTIRREEHRLVNPGGFFRYKLDKLVARHGIDLRAPP